MRACAPTRDLLPLTAAIAADVPFKNMQTRGGGRMSVAITNCGSLGWVSDQSGYRYSECDPESGRPWPPLPAAFRQLATSAAERAGFPRFEPDACLVNRYVPGASMGAHQDKNEKDFTQPIVSVSLGLPAIFLWYGESRAGSPRRILVEDGDVLVWGGTARLGFHGIAKLAAGSDPLLGSMRVNLTLRRAGC
jgi:alkylated DNA repair protein (DNA oxidative demethylase)